MSPAKEISIGPYTLAVVVIVLGVLGLLIVPSTSAKEREFYLLGENHRIRTLPIEEYRLKTTELDNTQTTIIFDPNHVFAPLNQPRDFSDILARVYSTTMKPTLIKGDDYELYLVLPTVEKKEFSAGVNF